MSAQRLRDAAKVLRERATNENVPAGPWRSEWAGQECAVIDPTGDMVVENTYRVGAGCMYERSDVDGIEPYIANMHPGVALALADWLDAEAAVQDSMQPMAELVSLAIEQEGGPAGYVRILHDDDGNPQMQADSSPAAFRLTDLILGAE